MNCPTGDICTWVVFRSASEDTIEVLAKTRTAALVSGAELLNTPVTTLRAIRVADWDE